MSAKDGIRTGSKIRIGSNPMSDPHDFVSLYHEVAEREKERDPTAIFAMSAESFDLEGVTVPQETDQA